jgi:uncharacterized protein YndB with AHSA1/START domain
MTRHGRRLDDTTLQFERILDAPIEKVWAFIADGEKRARWFCGGAWDLRPGGRAVFAFDHRRISEVDDLPPEKYAQFAGETTMEGVIVDAERPRLVVYEWGDQFGGRSQVKFELAEDGDRTRLVVTHSKLADRCERLSAAAGWHAHLDILEAKLENRSAPSFWRAHSAVETEYKKFV